MEESIQILAATTTTDGNSNSTDPYAFLRAAHPLLASVTKETLPQFMTYLVAWMRCPDLHVEHPLIEDPLLEPISREIGDALAKFFPDFADEPEITKYVVLRHYCFDRAVATRDPIIHQIVSLGGALDTRAFRMEGLSDCTFFEMHLTPALMEYKEQKLRELNAEPKVAKRVVFSSQVHDDGWHDDLCRAGFDPNLPTYWILESTLQFIAPEEVTPLLGGIDHLSAPRSQLLTERLLGGGLEVDMDEDQQVELLVHSELRYGEDGGAFRGLSWSTELLLRRNQVGQYYGTMWDPVLFDRYLGAGKDVVSKAWFLVLLTKPE